MSDSERKDDTTVIGQVDADTPIGQTMECGAAISNERMDRFLMSFEASARRWELVVYPALFAFVVLAGYGFYLVYSLTSDVATLAKSVEHSMAQNLQVVAANMEQVSLNVATMSEKMQRVSANMDRIAQATDTMDPMSRNMDGIAGDISNLGPMLERMDSLQTMDRNMAAINQSITVMAGSMDQMRRDISIMNRSISPPANFMQSFMPW